MLTKGIILIIPLVFLQNFIFSQITISPDIGLSHRPHAIVGNGDERNARSPNFLIGASGVIPIYKKFLARLNLHYANRENQTIFNPNTTLPDGGDFYSQQDLSFDLTGLFVLKQKLNIVVGGTLIRKINTFLETSDNIRIPREHFNLNQNIYGGHFLVKYSTKYIDLTFRITRLFDSEIIGYGVDENLRVLFVKDGFMRYDLFIGVPFTSKKNKP